MATRVNARTLEESSSVAVMEAAVVWFSAALKATEPLVTRGKSLMSVTVTVKYGHRSGRGPISGSNFDHIIILCIGVSRAFKARCIDEG